MWVLRFQYFRVLSLAQRSNRPAVSKALSHAPFPLPCSGVLQILPIAGYDPAYLEGK